MKYFLVFFISAFYLFAGEATSSYLHSIPKVKDINIDAKSDDWKDQGVELLMHAAWYKNIKYHEKQKIKMGWNDNGLYFLFEMDDKIINESTSTRRNAYMHKDGIQIYISSDRGSSDIFTATYIPRLKEDNEDISLIYKGPQKNHRYYSQTAIKKSKNSYVFEVLLPWSNLQNKYELGDEIAIQIITRDSDDKQQATYAWYPGMHPIHKKYQYRHLHRVKLVENADTYPFSSKVTVEKGKNTLHFYAPNSFDKKNAVIKVDGVEVHKAELLSDKNKNCAYFSFEYQIKDIKNSDATIEIDGKSYGLFLSN